MFKSPYDTLPCRFYKLDHIVQVLQVMHQSQDPALIGIGTSAIVQGPDGHDYAHYSHVVVDGAPPLDYFSHPITFTTDILVETIGDARDTTKMDYSQNFKITSQAEYNLIRARVILQSNWLTAIAHGDAPIHGFPMEIYANWLADALTRRFNLDLDASVRVRALAAFMYISMHKATKEFEEHELVSLSLRIASTISVPANIVTEVLTDPIYFSNVEDFCDAVTTRITTSRLDGLNPTVLYGIIKGSWFGKNAAELVQVGVEHPPTFDALCYAAGTTSSLQRTLIGTIVKRDLKSKDAIGFIEKISRLIIGE